jgi:hypothetical protein
LVGSNAQGLREIDFGIAGRVFGAGSLGATGLFRMNEIDLIRMLVSLGQSGRFGLVIPDAARISVMVSGYILFHLLQLFCGLTQGTCASAVANGLACRVGLGIPSDLIPLRVKSSCLLVNDLHRCLMAFQIETLLPNAVIFQLVIICWS